MFKNYLKSAWRNLVKNKVHSLINITGLSVGMAVAMLIGLWIWNELSFDQHFHNYNRIAQVMQNETHNGQVNTTKGNVIPLAAELRKNYGSDFKYVVLSSWSMNSLIASDKKKLNTQGNYMETGAPELLSLDMVAGTRKSFHEASTLLLSQSMSKALFGNDDPIGKMVKIDIDILEKVVGVYKDFPQNSSFKEVSFIAPFGDLTSWVNGNETNWYDESFQVFVELADNSNMHTVSAKIKDIKLDKIDAQTAKLEKPQMFLQPMSNWHLYSEFKNGDNAGGAIQYVWMFAIIGGFVLLLACINFMNLSTARSEKRAKEVGIRKAIGSLRGQLIKQFFTESLLMAALAFAVSILLVQLTLPYFNWVSGKNISLPLNNIYFWLWVTGFSVLTGMLSGLYPALYLSSFQPLKVLKGTYKAGRSASIPRKALVVVQFTVSVVLIISTITVYRQVLFAKSRPAGYSKQGLISILMQTYNYHNHFAGMRNDLLAQGAVTEMAESNTPVTENDHFNNGFTWQGMNTGTSAKFNTVSVSETYGKTVGFELLEGRDFSSAFASDSNSIIINETAAKYIGFKNTIGETIKRYNKSYRVIGVVKDMVMESPYEPAKQTLYFLDSAIGGILNLRLNPALSTAAALGKLEAVCKKYSPEELFDYKFADEEYALKFADEERVGKLAAFFTTLAVFISCLGIFGMASFMAEQRTKEIGVRKVLGASVLNLCGLLSKEFVIMVLIALLIATPLAYYFMHNWLAHYAYRTDLSWWVFGVSGFGALVITLLTVSFQSIKAALANPVKNLRTE
jgi:putative ABC transport system permease protein